MLAKIFTALMMALTGLLPSSCSSMNGKEAAEQAQAAHFSSSITSTNRNLGNLELTNYYEACVELGAGKSCLITPKIISHNHLQLTVAVESRKTDGETASLIVTQVITKPGKFIEVAVGGMNFALTPQLAAE